nr:immunoglobulin heavy chain junction region [Homo sapiens]
QPESRGHGRI